MDTLQFEIFASVAETMNFSRTADQLYITQPTVSHHMKTLESTLGVKLIARSSHGVALTHEGREFLPYVKQMLEIMSTAENRVQNIAEGRLGHIRVAALSSTTNQLTECLVRLYKLYPQIQVDVDLLEGSEMIEAIRKNEYDFYFSADHMLTKEFEHIVVGRDRLALFVNRDIADTVDLSDWRTVARQPFVSVPQSDARLSNHMRVICKNRGFKPHIINYYNRAESVVLSVNAGIGIAMLPLALGQLYQRQNVLTLPIEGNDAELISVFAWNTGELTTACGMFKDIVLSMYAGCDSEEET